VLSGFGLNNGEEAVYLALVEASSATMAELRQDCPGVRARLALASLESKGLVSRLAGTPARYAAAPPDVALELIAREREQELARARMSVAPLTARYRQARASVQPHEVIEVVIGFERTVRRWEQLQRSARQQVRSFDRPPYLNPTSNPVEVEMLAAGLAFRSVYDVAGFAVPGRPAAVRSMIAAGEQARVARDVPVKMFIADDQLGLLPLEINGGAESCLVIRESSLLDTLIALFELVWDQAVAIHGDDELPAPEAGPNDEETTLMSLLAAGLTDAAIARHLGTHPRTVQRRVRSLLDHLGAGTRFQAGLQAVRRGWLLPSAPRAAPRRGRCAEPCAGSGGHRRIKFGRRLHAQQAAWRRSAACPNARTANHGLRNGLLTNSRAHRARNVCRPRHQISS
jgi:DNA-binding CsgD family transcriptional regulator